MKASLLQEQVDLGFSFKDFLRTPGIIKKKIFGSKIEKDIASRSAYLKKHAVKEIRMVFNLLQKSKMTPNNRFAAYGLLIHINERWPPKNKKVQELFAKQLLMLKDKIPVMARLAYEASIKGILIDTWKMTAKDVKEAAKIGISLLPIVIVLAGGVIAYIGYTRYIKPLIGKWDAAWPEEHTTEEYEGF